MKKNKVRKLALAKETVRNLELGKAGGGTFADNTLGYLCLSAQPFNCPNEVPSAHVNLC